MFNRYNPFSLYINNWTIPYLYLWGYGRINIQKDFLISWHLITTTTIKIPCAAFIFKSGPINIKQISTIFFFWKIHLNILSLHFFQYDQISYSSGIEANLDANNQMYCDSTFHKSCKEDYCHLHIYYFSGNISYLNLPF